MKINSIDVHPVSDGYFRLDGGAMFGVVPRVLWEKRALPDGKNRIKMGLWCLLIKAAGKNILVNTGIGDKYNRRYQDIYEIQHPPALISSLAEHNVQPADIDMVILTHLHFDHCGGNTISQNNKIMPAFPKAKYIVQKAEWEKAVSPTERTRASYIKENLIPIKEAGLLELIDGDKKLLSGISVRVTGGHTRGHQIVFIESGNKKAVYWSDLIPTTAHIDLPYIMSYDLYPEETLEEKRRLVEQAIKEDWICFWEHDPAINCGYIRKDIEGKLTVEPLA
ncbi:MAG: MBL fold metallo-hydrolase [Planctomycetes bacterium]|nr:MBL fold metallo-hydrolase [Planctomycetota bacterium]